MPNHPLPLRFAILALLALACGASFAAVAGWEPSPRAADRAGAPADRATPPSDPRLKPVGTGGFYAIEGPFARFDPAHPSVEIWTPKGRRDAPMIVYAHGGAGLRDDDRARLAMLRRNGFATLSFDAYRMNGFDDWNFVTRHVTNRGKQDMIGGVFQGAVAHALRGDGWDGRNIFFYGASNGGRVVLHAGTALAGLHIRGIISEAPAGSGHPLGDYDIPTIILFGALDTWAGRSENDYIWKRRYPDSPQSIEDWVQARQAARRPVNFLFYQDAGHLMFDGPLERVTERRGRTASFTAYRGAAKGVLARYERDILSFIARHRAAKAPLP